MSKLNPFREIPTFLGEEFKVMYPISEDINIKPNIYIISNYGRIFSLVTDINGPFYNPLSVQVNRHVNNGYVYINLDTVNNNRKAFRVHRLVMLFFNYNPNYENLEVNHINGDKTDNRIWNLEWCTRSENMIHATKMGLNKTPRSLSDNEAREIKIALLYGTNRKELANKYNIDIGIIHDIAADRIYKDIDISDIKDAIDIQAKNMDPELIYNIYSDTFFEKSNNELSYKYDISPNIIQLIRIMHPSFKSIITKYNKKSNPIIDEKIILNIYNDRLDGMNNNEICNKYNISMFKLSNILKCSGKYDFLVHKYGYSPLYLRGVRVINEKEAIEIFKMCKYMKTSDIVKETGISSSIINMIRQCKGRFNFIKDKYGYTPYDK